LMQRQMPDQPFMNYIMTNSIDKSLQKVERAGGVVVMPKKEIGQNMGWIAAFKDTEGNTMGFHEAPSKPAVKTKPAKKAAKKK
jgi:predicted enzyme related to lactoylglutathione lyase